MAQQIKSTSGDLSAAPVAAASDHSEMIALSARTRTMEQADAVIARRLNGPLTALLRYMSEIKQRSDRMAEASDERAHLKSIVEHALQQTEQVCALVKLMSGAEPRAVAEPADAAAQGRPGEVLIAPGEVPLRKPLTRREREVLQFISEGLSNKQGALRMNISPRTFESHRAEAMRKLGARNTAELVRAALLNQLG